MTDDADLQALATAIRIGDVASVQRGLTERPELATRRAVSCGGRTLLHVATDWPGHFPHVADTIATLVAAGADPNAAFLGAHAETPLHWAASSGDIEALDALLDAGADVNAPGAVIGGGTPLADATAFGNWDAARRLVDRGAVPNLFDAAALGLPDRVAQLLDGGQTTRETITSSFWGACHGGQRRTADMLLAHGADLNWVGYDGLTPLDAAHRSGAADLSSWLRTLGARSSLTS